MKPISSAVFSSRITSGSFRTFIEIRSSVGEGGAGSGPNETNRGWSDESITSGRVRLFVDQG